MGSLGARDTFILEIARLLRRRTPSRGSHVFRKEKLFVTLVVFMSGDSFPWRDGKVRDWTWCVMRVRREDIYWYIHLKRHVLVLRPGDLSSREDV